MSEGQKQGQEKTAWEIVTEVMKALQSEAKVGVTTTSLDELAEKMVVELGGKPANKGYLPAWATTPYPATLCTCFNEEICHGFPSDRVLKDGDLLGLDIGVEKDGLCGDSGLTIGIGKVSDRDQRLLDNTKKTLMFGISLVRDGVDLKELGDAMETFAWQRGFVINRTFCGHGIGSKMHDLPQIPFWGAKEVAGITLKAGQMICLEPMLTYKDMVGVRDSNGWLWRTKDNKKSCFMEHQLLVTPQGCEILTKHFD